MRLFLVLKYLKIKTVFCAKNKQQGFETNWDYIIYNQQQLCYPILCIIRNIICITSSETVSRSYMSIYIYTHRNIYQNESFVRITMSSIKSIRYLKQFPYSLSTGKSAYCSTISDFCQQLLIVIMSGLQLTKLISS